MSSVQEIRISATSEDEFVITSRKKFRIGNYDSIGRGEPSEKFEEGVKKVFSTICLYDVLIKYSASPTITLFLVRLLKERDYRNNLSFLDPKDKAESNAISLAYKALKEDFVIVRVKPKTYLINPYMVYPYFKNFNEVEQQWLTLMSS